MQGCSSMKQQLHIFKLIAYSFSCTYILCCFMHLFTNC